MLVYSLCRIKCTTVVYINIALPLFFLFLIFFYFAYGTVDQIYVQGDLVKIQRLLKFTIARHGIFN